MGLQSSTIKSYISAIKRILLDDGYQWEYNKMLLTAITKACKLKNDRVQVRLPIGFGLLELILFEVRRYFCTRNRNQPYLIILYQALFAMGYYGMLRVGELTLSNHMVKAKDVHLGRNKDKIKLILYTSKTHGKELYPQEIKIVANNSEKVNRYKIQRNFCPFNLMAKYFKVCKAYEGTNEPCFIFQDGTPVSPSHARTVLRQMLKNLGLNEKLYDMHSFHIGCCSDLVNKLNYTIEEAKRMGCWKSSCIYRYIRQ